ncbi:MAG: DEAD/DEAH box helicase [Lamprobacter sp.]|uniref:DEAD/DEAH box helicase n=1 Tax=Lamprobacter sp. TaxID=3100796 RepID=UPI002B258B9A|nr:DEAD/DEAH box helicase [Lamprobacter sp.]MEA3639940.1 DEAD/DEAH box helicase [Lamprobacter sp.]
MIVRKGKVVLHLRHPEKVTNIIPTSGTIEYQGKTLTVVPHRTPECRLLRNLGFEPPDPIDYYYDWPIQGGWQPWEHQKETARFLTRHARAYCLNDLGTAKTLSSLWAADFLRQEGAVGKMLIVAPLSTVERTWADEVFFNLPHLKAVVLHGTKQKRLDLLNSQADIYIINHDGVKVILDALTANRFGLIIIDELAQAARNAGTERWKAYRRLVEGVPYVWGMTGTPTPNEPTDAWAQCRLITPETVPQYFSRFRDRTMQQATQYKWVARPEASQIVHEAMQPAIRYARDDCISLPPVMYESREAALTTAQERMYKEMLVKLQTEWKGQEVTAVNEGVKAMKLVQIASGAVRGEEESIILCPPKHRLIALREIIEEASSKVIVFSPFRAALDQIVDIFSRGYSVGVIHGGVSKTQRDEVFSGFQKRDTYQLLVAQPAAMSHGLTLTAASVIVWFAPVTSAEVYEQANARITRPGQKHSQLIVHLQGTTLERTMYSRLKAKTNMQGVLLDMFKK